MAQLPCSDIIALPGTTNIINWTAIVSDSEWFLLEADLAPAGGSAGNVKGLMGVISSLTDFPSAPTNPGNTTFTQSSTNKTLPTKYEEVWIGNIGLAPPLVTIDATVNQEYRHLLGAIPIAHPPIIHRGQVFIIAAKNLGGSAQAVMWNINAVKVSNYAAGLIEAHQSSFEARMSKAISTALADVTTAVGSHLASEP